MTDARNTQEALEIWAMPNAQAQLTQVAAEMWAGVPATTVQALMTTTALEMWAVTGLAGGAIQARAMILA